jgi:hypothetical protein
MNKSFFSLLVIMSYLAITHKFYGLSLANFSCGCWEEKVKWRWLIRNFLPLCPKAFHLAAQLPYFCAKENLGGGWGIHRRRGGPLGTKKWPRPSSSRKSFHSQQIYICSIRNTYYYEHYKIIHGEILLVNFQDML